jgi:nicotinamidase-related amidase
MIEPPAAMLVVEMQNDLVSPALCDEKGLSGALARAVRDRNVIENLARALAVCRTHGIPILYATKERLQGVPPAQNTPLQRRAGGKEILVRGTQGAAVVDALAPADGDQVVARLESLDPSHGSDLWERLDDVRTVIVGGVSTTIAVEGTVRAAANRGFNVVVLEDCCATVPDEWHRFSVENILPLLALVSSSADLPALLA